jgi:YD repeat-containing protein
MERSLDPGLLGLALGDQQGLPSPDELSTLISQAEVGLLLHEARSGIAELESAAWYLHAVASTRRASSLYDPERRTAAFRVSAHILDVLVQMDPGNEMRARWAFAAAIGFLRCGLDPNATAVYRRFDQELLRSDWTLYVATGRLASTLGCALLAVDAQAIFQATESLLEKADTSAEALGQSRLTETPLAAIEGVIRGVRALTVFLLFGREGQRRLAEEYLRSAVQDEASRSDYTTRWVAAHLLDVSDGLANNSVWHSLPPETPAGLRSVLAKGTPRVATFWPPQLEILRAAPGPLAPDTKRAVLGMPTSAGKTLFSQVVVLNHVMTEGTGVAFVAPTRSLCNEVRYSLETRLRMLDFTVAGDLPDSGKTEALLGHEPDVEVMTPERLLGLLRQDLQAALDRFGLFIFDEVHNVGDESRGWTMESAISLLHTASARSRHKIILMSAALGNQSQFVQWMGSDGEEVLTARSDWRAPRRLHCIWTTTRDESSEAVTKINSSKNPTRWTYDLYGRLVARPTSRQLVSLHTDEPVGMLVTKDDNGRRSRDGSRSTPIYKTLVPLVDFLEETGPVLVIQATRPSTLWTAKAIAAERVVVEETEDVANLLQLVEARLGREHPLLEVLSKGVGYHHGSLPLDVREELERAVRAGTLKVLVATTTLTEGVNLPVKSVVVGALGAHGPNGYEEFILGAKLINAIGRAGRAAQETEGIVVLAWNQAFEEGAFSRLDPPSSEFEAHSRLSSAEAIAALGDFEELQRHAADALLTFADEPFASVLSMLWFVEDLLQRPASGLEGVASSLEFLMRTLAWDELQQDQRERLERVVDAVHERVIATPESTRRRWARAGASIPSAARLSEIADQLGSLSIPDEAGAAEQVRLLLADGRLESLLALSEAPGVAVFNARGGKGRRELDVALLDLIQDWMLGTSIGELGTRYLHETSDREFRAEQIGEVISDLCEKHLPWALAIVIDWANEEREQEGYAPIAVSLPLLVRWGVPSEDALQLVLRGVRSREVATAIVALWRDSSPGESSVRDWILSRGLNQLASDVSLSRQDVLDLLRYLRTPTGGLLPTVMAGRVASFSLPMQEATAKEGMFELDDAGVGVRVVTRDGIVVGRVPADHASDVLALVALGLALNVALDPSRQTVEIGLFNVDDVTPE